MSPLAVLMSRKQKADLLPENIRLQYVAEYEKIKSDIDLTLMESIDCFYDNQLISSAISDLVLCCQKLGACRHMDSMDIAELICDVNDKILKCVAKIEIATEV